MVRRLGPVDVGRERPPRWVGFAGLARTVVERLIEEGGRRDEDSESCLPRAHVLADIRHVMGGGCTAVSYTPLRQAIHSARAYIEREGGGGGRLHAMVCEAAETLSSAQPTRQGWAALRDMLACNIPRPDWPLRGGLTETEEEAALGQIEKRLTGCWGAIVRAAHEVRTAWAEAARPGHEAHQQREASRGIMRVLVRAWREYTDDVRAGAAKWDQRWEQCEHERFELGAYFRCGCGRVSANRAAIWQHRQQCAAALASPRNSGPALIHMTLAKRLVFMGPTKYASGGSWQVRMILAWQRLVRAGKVHRARWRAPMWREAEQDRISTLAGRHAASSGWEATDWGAAAGQIRGVRYEWRRQEEAAREMGVTSGAAAVLAKRRHADSGHGQHPPQRPRRDGDDPREHGCKRPRDAFGDG